jgi:HPt (histidine-containing phosphotransfer) domain-containing protein
MNDPNLLDPEALELLRSLEQETPGAMRQLVHLFVADAPAQLKRIENAYRLGDVEEVRRAAHFLRSGAMALGARRLGLACRAVERLEWAQYGQLQAQQCMLEVRNELPLAMGALLDLLGD